MLNFKSRMAIKALSASVLTHKMISQITICNKFINQHLYMHKPRVKTWKKRVSHLLFLISASQSPLLEHNVDIGYNEIFLPTIDSIQVKKMTIQIGKDGQIKMG